MSALLAAADEEQRAVVESALGDPHCPAATVERVRELARRLGVDRKLRADMRRCAETAAAEAGTWHPHWREEAVAFFAGLPLANVVADD